MELLLPMATKKLDLSFSIESDVPDCMFQKPSNTVLSLMLGQGCTQITPVSAKVAYRSYLLLQLMTRLVLMNLIGNAVKFTAAGYVRVNCSVEDIGKVGRSTDKIALLKFDILFVYTLFASIAPTHVHVTAIRESVYLQPM
jgi:signal transduction histidine kinase